MNIIHIKIASPMHRSIESCIALLTAEENKYPFNEVTYQEEIDRLMNSGEWSIFTKTAALLILIKK